MPLAGRILLFCLIAAFAGRASAADGENASLPPPESTAGPDLADVFDFSQSPRPRPGDWLEYHLAFPVDPLENSLRTDPAPIPGIDVSPSAPADATNADDGAVDFNSLALLQPLFEPPAAWRTVPVRLEIREVDDEGCNAEITFANGTRPIRLSASGRGAQAEFHYDAGAEADKQIRVGGNDYTVHEVRRTGSGYGFVRWFSPEIPFGTVRFATEHIDVQLVGVGRGTPPDFPLRPAAAIAPALGILY